MLYFSILCSLMYLKQFSEFCLSSLLLWYLSSKLWGNTSKEQLKGRWNYLEPTTEDRLFSRGTQQATFKEVRELSDSGKHQEVKASFLSPSAPWQKDTTDASHLVCDTGINKSNHASMCHFQTLLAAGKLKLFYCNNPHHYFSHFHSIVNTVCKKKILSGKKWA